MAAKTEQLLIVVSILEGRHFPKSPRLSLVVQASFDGEHLATDPVEHREQPQFSTELAWELDRRTLHQHRLQRTPIKLQCFAVDSVSKKREGVGYIVLDLRSVSEVKQEPRWFQLLSSKYTKQRPALLISASLENDAKPSEPSPDGFRARKAPPRQGSPAVAELLPDKLEAVLVPDQGYHQVGPEDRCSHMFVLSVTVAFATKLEQLIPSTMNVSAESSDFFFYYSLLGNDITSEPFHNLLSPDFEPERASVRIRSSSQVLRSFLSQQPGLQVHLCCGNRSLGGADVSLSSLSAAAVDLDTKAATVEGAFVLHPPQRNKRSLPPLPSNLQPTVGVAVTVRREEVAAQTLGNKGGSSALTNSVLPSSSLLPVAEQKPPAPGDSSPPPPLPPPPLPPASCQSDSEGVSLEELRHDEEEERLAAADLDVPVPVAEATTDDGVVASSVSVSAPRVSIPAAAHHYCFSLDLRSLGNLNLTHPIAATLRYSYRFFGSAAPIMTNPPVDVQRNMEASLPQSFCAFDFAALPQQLHDTFLRVPLVVELWHRDSSSRDQLIGRASVQLFHLLNSEKSRHQTSWRQTHQDRIPVVKKTTRSSEKVAELSYVATLDDLGLVKDRDVVVSDSSQATEVGAPPPPPHQSPPPHQPPPPPLPPASRETLEYRTALELELWKEEQEDLFDHQLRRKELSHMTALADEWRRRDGEREALMKKKELEFNQLEQQLQKTLCDLEKREKQLCDAELQTQRLQKELRAEHDLIQNQLQETSRRLQLDCDHRVALERDKVRLMEEERTRLLQQISDGESRLKQLESEFHLYREKHNNRPEISLQSHINLLSLEKVELERKLESTTKSKLHYKQQWGRALKELARFKQREQENAMTRLKKQQAELEAMRLRYLATEEKEAVRQDRRELDDVRNELNRLKQQDGRLGHAPSASGPAPSDAGEHLSRLLEERDALLRTGVYHHDDRIIAELSRQIQDAMTSDL